MLGIVLCCDCRVIRSALFRLHMSMLGNDGVLRNSIIIIGGQWRQIRKIVLLNPLSFSHVSCKFPALCWHSFISVPISETYLCLAGHVGEPFSPSAVRFCSECHPIIISCYFITLPLPTLKCDGFLESAGECVCHTSCGLITEPCREITWDWDVGSAVTNIQLEDQVGLLINQSISTWLIEHIWSEASASETRIYRIIRNETDSHTDNYLPQQGISVSARA